VILIGSQALGSLVWGVVASDYGLIVSLTASAVLLVVAAASVGVQPLLPETGDEQLAPGGQSGHLST
jgi:thiol:disulfide interchange protein